MYDRWINIFFFLGLVFLFILFANAEEHQQVLMAVFLASLLALLAFIINWLTIDGAISAFIFGSIAYGLGGIPGAVVILGFFISGSILSKDLISQEGFLEKKFRRNGVQVWANGFWFALWTMIWFLSGAGIFMIAAVTSIASATSDTWATEIGGNRVKGKTWLISTGEKVKPGTDGGISFLGTLASLAGAVLISSLFWIVEMQTDIYTLLIITISGFLGCQVDSYIGARFQNKNYDLSIITLFGKEYMYVDNNFVNWISAGLASIISLILILIISV